MEKQRLSIAEIQKLIEGKTNKEGGEILSSSLSGRWCGVWHDWFCNDSQLSKRAGKFIPYIKALKGEWTKKHYIWLKNNCPMSGALYDDIRISPISDDKHYNIGFSWGNKDTRDREVFDTRNGKVVSSQVKNCKEASNLVNELMKECK